MRRKYDVPTLKNSSVVRCALFEAVAADVTAQDGAAFAIEERLRGGARRGARALQAVRDDVVAFAQLVDVFEPLGPVAGGELAQLGAVAQVHRVVQRLDV